MAAARSKVKLSQYDKLSWFADARPSVVGKVGMERHEESIPTEAVGSGGSGGLRGFQERRRRRRVVLPPMYTRVAVRVLASRQAPLEGHIIDLSETGMAVELDFPVAIGESVTVEFRVSGLGNLREGEWMEYVAAAEVVRQDLEDDFGGGPYRIALKLVEVATMTQAQIARFVAGHG